ncbi:hypothetical protein, partial [Paenibacillus sp. ALJ109b]|uniref:hypothetical protein n=1 Tax=Paenibacillus sp. ALJ109b TaxID=2709068 RepID=UPI0019674381
MLSQILFRRFCVDGLGSLLFFAEADFSVSVSISVPPPLIYKIIIPDRAFSKYQKDFREKHIKIRYPPIKNDIIAIKVVIM